MSSHKVYVIDEPHQTATRKKRSGKSREHTSWEPTGAGKASFDTKGSDWRLVLRAYFLGPINLILWPRGRSRHGWPIIGLSALFAVPLLWYFWDGILNFLSRFEHGSAIGILSASFVVVLASTAWARAIATSTRGNRWPRVLRRGGSVCVLGFVFPGLGLLIMGHRRKAAFAFWCVGLLVAGLVMAKQWYLLCVNSRASETVLVAAIGCVALGLLAWLVSALDGVRSVSPASKSGTVANWMALVLLAGLVTFLATLHPSTIAQELNFEATRLQNQGLRTVPLALYEAASTIDPSTPTPLVRAAELCDEMGLSDEAEAKRNLLQMRADQFASAIGAELVPVVVPAPWSPPANQTWDAMKNESRFFEWTISPPEPR